MFNSIDFVKQALPAIRVKTMFPPISIKIEVYLPSSDELALYPDY